MLVLQRSPGESICIDLSHLTHDELDKIQREDEGQIVIQLVKIRTTTYARLGIKCPKIIPVHRQEVVAAIEAGKKLTKARVCWRNVETGREGDHGWTSLRDAEFVLKRAEADSVGYDYWIEMGDA